MGFSVQENVSLSPYTVFKIGGLARFFVEAKSAEELKEALRFAKERSVPFFVAGAGSNILVSDKGFGGLYIKNGANRLEVNGEKIFCESGVMMPYLASLAGKNGLAGLEWGIGVPGTVGGSVRGNAGCFGSETKDVVESVEAFDAKQGRARIFSNEECQFGYRDSFFKHNPGLVVLSAALALKKGDEAAVRSYMRGLAERRSDTQDIGVKCAGCIFKNIPWARRDIQKEELIKRFAALKRFEKESGVSTGFLIDEAGLKGRRIGGVMISRKHANFFINEGAARAEDVVMLIAMAKEYVHRKFGILLEEEIQYVGF